MGSADQLDVLHTIFLYKTNILNAFITSLPDSQKIFTVDVDLLQYENLNIVFEGLDTISTVKINDVVVGESDNMFVRYIFNITSVLKVSQKILIK